MTGAPNIVRNSFYLYFFICALAIYISLLFTCLSVPCVSLYSVSINYYRSGLSPSCLSGTDKEVWQLVKVHKRCELGNKALSLYLNRGFQVRSHINPVLFPNPYPIHPPAIKANVSALRTHTHAHTRTLTLIPVTCLCLLPALTTNLLSYLHALILLYRSEP